MTPKERTERRQDLHGYVLGLGLALILSALPFAAVMTAFLPTKDLLWCVAFAGLIQMVVHFRFFLHIDLSKSHRDDLQLILFSVLIVLLMVGGTLWVIGNERTMMG